MKDSHEVYFHILEAIAVNLTIERGPVSLRLPSCSYLISILCQPSNPSSANPATAGSAGMSAYGTQTNSTSVNDQFSHLPNLQRSIVKFILSQPTREEGIHVGVIAQAIGNGIDPNKIGYGQNFIWRSISIADMKFKRCIGYIIEQWRCIYDDRRLALQRLVLIFLVLHY